MFDEALNLCGDEFLQMGVTLTVEEMLILGVSLPTLQQENRFASVGFQAKIFGTRGDYYIAYGRGKDFIRNKMFFYSLDGRIWRLLFPPSADDLSEFRCFRNRFTGDPTEIHRLHVADRKIEIREDNRLSAAIHLMDWETAIGPKGALQINSRTGKVEQNTYFKGLLPQEMDDLSSYLHHRLPKSAESFVPASHLRPAAGDAALEFLEPISNDYPAGCWIIRCDRIKGVVRLHSLWWPGHGFYHRQKGAAWGCIYMGLGCRNDDLPFML